MALRFKLRYQFYKTALLLFMKRTVKNIYNDRKSKHFCFEVNSTARDVDESVHEFFSYMDADFDAVGRSVSIFGLGWGIVVCAVPLLTGKQGKFGFVKLTSQLKK
jgi:hypothetical protein